MSAPQCSVCGLEGVRLYRPLYAEPRHDIVRCNGHVPGRPELRLWTPHVPDAWVQVQEFDKALRAMAAWVGLPEAARTPVWTGDFGWIDIENAPGAK